jgi:hypothetical protein
MHLKVSDLPPLVYWAGSLVIIDSNRDFRGAIPCSVIGDGLLLYNAAGGRPGDPRPFFGLECPDCEVGSRFRNFKPDGNELK